MTEDGHKLGEVLRTAREAKGADLARVERETKIRERYLSALERGEYRELPGSVYTRGFLRNYAAYLDLDAEYLIDLYRLETSTGTVERTTITGPPRPMSVRRRRTFVVTPGAVAAAILTVLVGAFVAWLGYQFVNFARTPELIILEPPGDVAAHTGATITLRGVAAPNATINISGLPENPTTTADADGSFEISVGLLPGSNEIHVTARDPVTNRTSEDFVRRVNVVSAEPASPPGQGSSFTLTSPAADATLTGPVGVGGTAAAGEGLAVTATLVSVAAPTFTITGANGQAVPLTPADPTVPAPLALIADAAGAFNGSLALSPGTWDLAVAQGSTPPVTRRVTVSPAAGLSGTLEVDGGETYLEIDVDGAPLVPVSGGITGDGESIGLIAERTIRVRAGNSGVVRLTINGVALGAMGGSGDVVEWQIARSGG
ncbi:MAG: helix-turn-helix domain-containing protein [Candidatus Limnocylindria bacterium]